MDIDCCSLKLSATTLHLLPPRHYESKGSFELNTIFLHPDCDSKAFGIAHRISIIFLSISKEYRHVQAAS